MREDAPVRNPIDAFIQQKLRDTGLEPSPEADARTLIRRVSLDLTGLPPAPEDVARFLNDPSSHAYEDLVDSLLASPAYGERMAWDWLDVARYADTNGYQGDRERTMWPWRDWVIDSFNENLSYDQFTVWQLAGDLLPEATQEQQLATGFCRNHMINGEGGRIPEENRVDYVMDMTETVGTVWLGLTLNCCRCHDHKYDPLTRRDYYSLFAFFNQTPVTGGGGDPQTPPVLDLPTQEQQARIATLEQELADIRLRQSSRAEELLAAGRPESAAEADEDEGRQAVLDADGEYARLTKDTTKREQQLKQVRSEVVKVMVMQDLPEPRTTYLLERGLYNQPGEERAAATPASLSLPAVDTPQNRLGLARWLVSPEHPLTARVTVNRFWQQVFGVGLVKTPEDFGGQGEIPAHLDLLNWLAADFRDHGWDVKRLMRLMVTSHTYRQSSRQSAALTQRDPDNRLLARGPRFRMPFWMVRDQALAASGLLVDQVGGPAVNGYQPPGIWEEATFGNKKYEQARGAALYRRSLYTFWRRIIAPTMFFDAASRQTCSVKISRTNTPLQALLTLNDVQYVEAARQLATLALQQESLSDGDRLDHVFARLLTRPAGTDEQQILLAGLARSRDVFARDQAAAEDLLAVGESPRDESIDVVEHASWTTLCLALFNLDEAVTKE